MLLRSVTVQLLGPSGPLIYSITQSPYYIISEPGELSRYSERLRAGRPRGPSSSPGKVKNFHFFI
jgi:hypothetical protein